MVEHQGDSPIMICDYGAADGRNTECVITSCIDIIRARDPTAQIPIVIIYEDQTNNDFISLFKSKKELLVLRKNVYVLASGTNFYVQCLPKKSIHFAYSSIAVHWLSRKPCQLSGGVFHFHSTSARERQLFATQAADDWVHFLLLRADELADGGQMVIVTVMYDLVDGETKNMLDLMSETWKVMFEKKCITEEEYMNAQVNLYFKTKEELLQPWSDVNGQVYKSGLRLLSAETRKLPCSVRTRWDTKRDPESTESFADELTEGIRAWTLQSLLSALSDSRSDEEKDRIIGELYGRYKETIRQRPHNFRFEPVIMQLHINKRHE